jgi:predicted Zn-dependent protease
LKPRNSAIAAVVLALALTPSCAELNKQLKDMGVNTDTDQMVDAVKTVGGATELMGYDEELALGGALALEVVSRFGGTVKDKKLQRYIATIGSAVAANSNRPDIPYFFAVLKSNEPNAFACPGGYIFITKGLLKLMKDESELAGTLAHEIAHVTEKHALKVIRRGKLLGGLTKVTMKTLNMDNDLFDGVINDMMTTIFDKGFDKGMEYEADAVGTEYLYRVGYATTGVKRIVEAYKEKVPENDSSVFKTHPSPEKRIDEMKDLLEEQKYQGTDNRPVLTARFGSFINSAVLSR